MITSGSNVSSKRGGGLLLILCFVVWVTVMVLNKDYTLVKFSGMLAGTLLGLGILDKFGKK